MRFIVSGGAPSRRAASATNGRAARSSCVRSLFRTGTVRALAALMALTGLAVLAAAPAQAQDSVTVTIEAQYEKIGGGLEDLNFTLTRGGATTAPLDVTVTITQDQAWLDPVNDLVHTVTFGAGEASKTLPIRAHRFSFDPVMSGDLTATVSGTGVQGTPSDTVVVVSTAEPAITIGLDMPEYTFREDDGDAAVYAVVTLHADYPRPPSRSSQLVALSARQDSARGGLDYRSISVVLNISGISEDQFERDSDTDPLVARVALDGFALYDDYVYEGRERFELEISNSGLLTVDMVQFEGPDRTTCAPSRSCKPKYPVFITDDENMPELLLSAAPMSIAEEDDSTTMDVFENVATLTVGIVDDGIFGADQTITLTFSGSAEYGTHYSVSPADDDGDADGHQVFWSRNQRSVEVRVTATGNATADGNRTVTVSGAVGESDIGTATVTILDDETTTTNNPATGKPTVTGTAQVGEVLTAAKGTIADLDGLPSGMFPSGYTFQWVRVDTSANETIVGVAGTYMPTIYDAGSTIVARVSFTDGAGNREERASDATAAVPLPVMGSCESNAVWCTRLTVGKNKGVGYCGPGAGINNCDYGSLDDDDFTLVGTDYTVESVRWGSFNSTNVHLTLDKDFPAAGLGSLTLRIGTSSFGLCPADRGGSAGAANNYRWRGSASSQLWTLPENTQIFVQLLSDGTATACSDATLSALALTDGDSNTVGLSPTFASGTDTYTASVGNTVERITVNPTLGDTKASFAYLDGDNATLTDADGDPMNGFQVDLEVGANVIRVKVTAANGTDTETYQVTVTRSMPGTCSSGTAVPNPTGNPGLVADCETLLGLRDTLDGSTTDGLNWTADIAMSRWTGIETSLAQRVFIISLRATGLSGSIPAALGDLTALEDLYLSGNDLSGTIPAALGQLTAMEFLHLDGNKLTGSIPAALGNFAALEELRLSGNDLSGPIPTELGGLAALTQLHLDGNKLSGTIPAALGNLAALDELHLNGNDLSGMIPAALGDLSKLDELSLSNNDISGPIPLALVNLTGLQALGLRDNRLTDCVPAQFGRFGADVSEQKDDDTLPACAIVADAGTDALVSAGDTVTLQGAVTGDYLPGVTLQYKWAADTGSAATNAMLSATDIAEPVFTVPDAEGSRQRFRFTLEVSDEEDTSRKGLDTVTFTLPGLSADLKALKLLEPDGTEVEFDSGLRSIWPKILATVRQPITVLTIVATPEDEGATVEYRRSDGTDIPDEDTEKEGHQVALWSYRNTVVMKVRGVEDVREKTYRLTVRRLGLRTQEPATGRLEITGTARVGETLRVEPIDVTDANGTFYAETGWLPNGTRNNFSYFWRVEAGPNTVEGIGRGRSVTLDKNENVEGRRVWVSLCFRDDLDNLECIVSDKTQPVAGEPLVISSATRVLREGSRCDYVYPAGPGCDAETSARNIGSPLKVLTRDGNVEVPPDEVTFSVETPSRTRIGDEFGKEHDVILEFGIDSNGQLHTLVDKSYPHLETPLCTREDNYRGPCAEGSIHSWHVRTIPVKVTVTHKMDNRYGTVEVPMIILAHPNAVRVRDPSDLRCDGKQCYGRSLVTGQQLYGSNAQLEQVPLTASFEEVPATHDGTTPFTFQVDFSADIDNTADEVGAAFQVTGGEVTDTNKVDDRSDLWLIEITPGGTANIAIALTMNAECGTAGALCTSDGRMLGTTPLAIVAGETNVNKAVVNNGPLTASFEEAPESHDGETPFTVRLVFSKPVFDGSEKVDQDRAVRDALDVSGGTATQARRVAQDAYDAWEIDVTPSGDGQVGIAVEPPAGDCTDATAACTPEGGKLAGTATVTIAGPERSDILPELTASFENVPAEHGGEESFSFDLKFSEAIKLPGGKVRTKFTVTNGRMINVSRIDNKHRERDGLKPNQGWNIWIEPDSATAGVTIVLPATTDCNASGAICTEDGRKLSNTVSATVAGPAPGVSVTDATVAEGEGAVLAFAVELEHAAPGAVSVAYATEDVTTTAGEDYTTTSGTLTFAAGETQKTIEVPVVYDAHNEEDETLTLKLSNPSRAYLADGEATGTIENTAPPLTARFENVPEEHDGTHDIVFNLVFSEEVFEGTERLDKNRAVREALQVTGGRARASRRLVKSSFNAYEIKVGPAGADPVTIALSRYAGECGRWSPLCTPGGAKLSNSIEATVTGPAVVSVSGDTVQEGPEAELEFAVQLSREAGHRITVDYATEDVSATAGADYTATSGTLAFEPGETTKTVIVAVLDDGHDEGSETMTLRISNASGGYIKGGEATATGTIENTDRMPAAWLARFGRTVAEQVLEAVEERVRSAPQAGVQVTVAGQRLGGEAPDAERLVEAEAMARLESLSAWLGGETEARELRDGSRTVTPRELLTGSSFSLTAGADGMGSGLVSLWGRGAVSRFDGREGDLTLDGEVTGALLGADWTRERLTAGLMLNHARGKGGYRGSGSGEVASTVTGLHPYGRYVLTDRVMLWGTVGYGAGTLTLTPEGAAALETGMDLAMAAVGLRGTVMEAPPEGGPELALKTDALVVRTYSETLRGGGNGADNLAATVADVTRLRLALEGTWRGLTIGTGTLAPRLEIGVRHDGGDAETGFGLDVGAGFAWSDPGTGLRAEASGRGLLTHEAGGFRELGIAGSLGWDPVPDSERGPSLTLTRSLGGSARGGAEALLGRTTLAGLAANDGSGDALERTDLRLGYGFGAFGGRFSSVPEAGFGMSGERREYSLGWRLVRDRRGDNIGSLEFALEARRRESADEGAEPEHGAGVRITARW